ncbi:MAG: ABC transporter substrate-binding protein [Alphaproteobacteria bacterium]|nr:ABC transporter substrate-binding protein [Alphaproteobacteria bacterium]
MKFGWGALLAGVVLGAGLGQPSQAETPDIGINKETRTVSVGGFTPVTGPVPFYNILTDAADAFFQQLNEKGGIRGWKVKYTRLDDGYEPARSVAVTRRLAEETKIFALVAPVGTATSVAVIPYTKEKGLPVIGPIGGSSKLFVEPHIFALLPDYAWSAASNAEYALGGLGLKRLALLWENDELGRSAKRGFDLYMQAKGIAAVESVPFEVKTTDFSPHIRRVMEAKADGVILFGSNANLAAALKASDQFGFKSTWFAPFFTADPSTFKLAGNLLNGVYFSSWLMPVDSDDPAIKTYRESVAKYYPKNPVGVFGLNGWSNAALFAVAFEKLIESGKPLTRENLVAALDRLKDAQVGGARNVSFKPGDHRGTRQEGIIRAENGGFKLVREFRPYPKVVFDAKIE